MITAAFTLDIGGFLSSLNKAKNALASTVGGSAGGAAGMAITGIGTAFAAVASVIAVAAKGMNDSIQEGQGLERLKDQTGVGVQKLMTLKTAFMQAGIGADQVGSTLTDLQSKITTAATVGGEAGYAFLRLGLSARELSTMSTDKAMEKVSNALGKVSNSAERTKLATELLGASGNKLATIFTGGGLEKASQTLGKQAEVMAQNSGMFDYMAGLLNSAGTKVAGFFTGMASEIAPGFIEILDAMNALDFTELGQQIGSIVSLIFTAFSQGKLGDLALSALMYAFEVSVNFLYKILGSVFSGLIGHLVSSFTMLMSPEFWAGWGNVLLAIVQRVWIFFETALNGLIGAVAKIPGLGSLEKDYNKGKQTIAKQRAELVETEKKDGTGFGGGFSKLKNVFLDGLGTTIESFKEGFKNTENIYNTTASQNELMSIFDPLKTATESKNKKIRQSYTSVSEPDQQAPIAQRYFIAPIASALQQIGGGGGFAAASNFNVENPLLDQARQQKAAQDRSNEILLQIASNTGNWSGKEVQALLK